jgi:hypothetical protein
MRRAKAVTRLKKVQLTGKSTEQSRSGALVENAKPSRADLVRRMDDVRVRSKPVDLETTLKIIDEARAERDARPCELNEPA